MTPVSQAGRTVREADKELVLVPDAGHNDLMSDDVYWDALARFVDRVVASVT